MEKDVTKVTATSTAETEMNKQKNLFSKERFEFSLSIITDGKESLICRRGFGIDGFIRDSMRTAEFENCVGEIVSMIQNDLVWKSRIYLWYHTPSFGVTGHYEVEDVDEHGNKTSHYISGDVVGGFLEKNPETGEVKGVIGYFPEWEPEVTSCQLQKENQVMLKFTVYDQGREVISRGWDATVYPSYVRKNIDLTNKLVRLNKDKVTYTYDKDKFFAENENVYGDLLMLKDMIMNREDLVPRILSLIRKACSTNSGYYDNINDYHTTDKYDSCDGKGKPHYGKMYDYNFNILQQNRKYYSDWSKAVLEKTVAYVSEHYDYNTSLLKNGRTHRNFTRKQ